MDLNLRTRTLDVLLDKKKDERSPNVAPAYG